MARHRVLVAITPRVFEASLAAALESAAVEVVRYHDAERVDLGEPYDAAVVTIELPDEVRPDVVITLPANDDATERTWLTVGQERRPLDLRSLGDVEALLRQHLSD